MRDAKGSKVERAVFRSSASAFLVDKGNYRHFMAKEIHEQPRVLAQTISGRLAAGGRDVVLSDLGLTAAAMRELEHVQIVACGTSWHAGLVGRYLIEGLAGIPVRVDYASEFRGTAALLPRHSLLITISQSGETADTLTALRAVKGRSVPTLTICNSPRPRPPRSPEPARPSCAGGFRADYASPLGERVQPVRRRPTSSAPPARRRWGDSSARYSRRWDRAR